ncbi:MAG: HigA family addiction module antidote protein [Rhodospirillales bacterium]|nr:HigA family addiction module antidote protein [Rhodospirillales bacterium]
MAKKLDPIHPGEILKVEFMEPLGLSANAMSRAIGVPANRITAIVNGTRGITGDTALRLSRFFGNTARFWMNLQTQYELQVAEDAAGAAINKIEKHAA